MTNPVVKAIVADVTSSRFWRGCIAELIGTGFLVLIGCGTCLASDWEALPDADHLYVSLAFGLIVATMVWCIGNISGGHINPAVTVGLLVARKITIVRAIFYIIAQCLGAVVGAGVLKAVEPPAVLENTTLCQTDIQFGVTAAQGVSVEALMTFVLLFTVFASCDGDRSDLKGSAPLSIGLAVGTCHFFAIKYTGSSMNPARTFGPAVVGGHWHCHWIYWLGPILGGVIGALLYDLVFAENASIKKLKAYFTLSGPSDIKGEYELTSRNDTKPSEEVAA